MKILAELLKMYGIAEVAGPKSNPELLKIINKHLKSTDDSTTAWCGISVGEAFDRAGYGKLKPANYAGARNWLKVGEAISLDEAVVAEGHTDIVVYWRDTPNGWKGHVGIYVGHNDVNIFTLSGNQGNTVSVAPYASSRLLGVRRVKEI